MDTLTAKLSARKPALRYAGSPSIKACQPCLKAAYASPASTHHAVSGEVSLSRVRRRCGAHAAGGARQAVGAVGAGRGLGVQHVLLLLAAHAARVAVWRAVGGAGLGRGAGGHRGARQLGAARDHAAARQVGSTNGVACSTRKNSV